MRILYDYQIFNMQRYGGVSRYFASLARELMLLPGVDVSLGFAGARNKYLAGLPGYGLRGRVPDGRLSRVMLRVANRQVSKFLLRRGRYDVFHPTYYSPYFLKHLHGKPFVLTVYDMIHEKLHAPVLAADADLIPWKKELVARASAIITISGKTRDDLLELYHVPQDRVHVVHLANSLDPFRALPPGPHIPPRFLLYVGQRTDYKNFTRLARALAPIMQQENDLHLICAGGPPFTDVERGWMRPLGVENRTLRVAAEDDGELAGLYRAAVALVFPSLYEGFGLPIVEAFGCGCPVVLSRASCFPEIAGEAGLYFDPLDEDSIRSALATIVRDDTVREEYRSKGADRGRLFSWKKAAEETRAIYQSIM
jgi:glycosyltransferase involved in cell wall biosynthesis